MSFYVEPIGFRSCCGLRDETPSDYRNEWIHHSACEVELTRLQKKEFDPQMSSVEQVDALGMLNHLIEGGIVADLRFPTGFARRIYAEVDSISRPPYEYLLELRHVPNGDNKKVFGRTKRVLRLYYFEPIALDRTLAALKLGSKPGDGPDLDDEQNQHIDDAHQRCMTWLQKDLSTGGAVGHDSIDS